jgi:GTP-binding protein YchF
MVTLLQDDNREDDGKRACRDGRLIRPNPDKVNRMKIGLVGFQGTGKTTVFNALTGLQAETGYGAARGKTNLGVVKVPDPRVDALAELFQPRKKTFAEITFSDVAADAAGGGSARGLDRGVLAAMREMESLCQVARAFVSADRSAAEPLAEVIELETEMILSDLELVEKRLERLKKEKGQPREADVLTRLKDQLEGGHSLRDLPLAEEEKALVAGFRFLTLKPLLIVLNVDEANVAAQPPPDAAEHARKRGLGLVVLSANVEQDIAQMPPADQREFIAALGLAEPARDRFVRAAFALLSLISFLTAGEDECRAWPIRKGLTAVKAAGKIHSDIERGFIRAEVMRVEDLLALRTEAKVREAGKFRVEGKDYVVQDGDVINFRFNV